MNNYDLESMIEDQVDTREIGIEHLTEQAINDDWELAMAYLYPEIDRDEMFDQ